ncbi:MAG: cysteine hydrolase, partial [Acidimicrobiales bacterium]
IPLAEMTIPGDERQPENAPSEKSPFTDRSPDSRLALVMLDTQRRVCDEYGDAQTVERLGEALRVARANKINVIFVILMFSNGYPELSPSNLQLSGIRSSGRFTSEDPGASIHEQLHPVEGELVLTKKRVSAFVGSGLDVALKSLSVNQLVLGGISTSGVVLATMRDAADRDFELTILSDACADPDPDLHRILLQRVFPRHGKVEPVSEWASRLETPA